MLTKLRLKNFKNFQDAELQFGGFTVLLGTNAAGKSNICDALRLLHGLAANYSIAEILGGRYENGALTWKGLRGWLSEIAFQKESTFLLEATYILDGSIDVTIDEQPATVTYSVEICTGTAGQSNGIMSPSIVSETIQVKGEPGYLLAGLRSKTVADRLEVNFKGQLLTHLDGHQAFANDRSTLSSIADRLQGKDKLIAFGVINCLRHEMLMMRNFDWDPAVMRDSALPGYTSIGSRGEGLTSVLHHLFQHSPLKTTFLDWLQALTPMDAVGLEFVSEESGKIALRIVEGNGHKVSAASASDGTLRFLAMLAAYFSAPPDSLYFLEELENGIHPTRVHLLLQLIEQQAKQGKVQTIATTHSPQLLLLANQETLEHVSLVYRLPDRPDAKIQRVMDIPNIHKVLQNEDLGRLQESGWLEDVMYFTADEARVE
jgi:predicted ATPase